MQHKLSIAVLSVLILLLTILFIGQLSSDQPTQAGSQTVLVVTPTSQPPVIFDLGTPLPETTSVSQPTPPRDFPGPTLVAGSVTTDEVYSQLANRNIALIASSEALATNELLNTLQSNIEAKVIINEDGEYPDFEQGELSAVILHGSALGFVNIEWIADRHQDGAVLGAINVPQEALANVVGWNCDPDRPLQRINVSASLDYYYIGAFILISELQSDREILGNYYRQSCGGVDETIPFPSTEQRSVILRSSYGGVLGGDEANVDFAFLMLAEIETFEEELAVFQNPELRPTQPLPFTGGQ